jgi:hypothetical protein
VDDRTATTTEKIQQGSMNESHPAEVRRAGLQRFFLPARAGWQLPLVSVVRLGRVVSVCWPQALAGP